MLVLRRLLTLALFGALTAAFAGPANAARPAPGVYPETMSTAHFQIHYIGPEVTHQVASDLATYAEQAYTTLVTSWAYPAPQNDGDGLADIWIEDLSLTPGLLGFAEQDVLGSNQSSGWIAIAVDAAGSPEVVAHEFMHLIQFGLWYPTDTWMLESTAEWAGLAVNSYEPTGGSLEATLGMPDMSLDCTSAACGDSYETAGYTRWEFFQYLSERFGVGVVRDVFARGSALADPLLTGAGMLASTLVAKGTTLTDVYNDFSSVQAAGSYQIAGLKGMPPIAYRTLPTGSTSVALPIQTVTVNHLATRYLRLTRGSGAGLCYAATLSLTVALPAGIASRPSFHSSSLGSTALSLGVNGSTASISVPWSTCAGGPDGYLALPNPNLGLDAQVFTVSGALNVDASTVVSPLGPPLPIYVGPVVTGGSTQIAPAIRVYGAQLIRVPAGTRKVRLIVFSSGPGKLRAAVGGKTLGTYPLRAGNNDIRFRVTVKTLKALRSTSTTHASNRVLTLTSLSTSGTKGKTVSRKLVVSKPTRR